MSRTPHIVALCTLALALSACEPAVDRPEVEPGVQSEVQSPDSAIRTSATDPDGHDAHAAPAGEGELLLTIMQRLGSDMVRLTLALVTEDRTALSEAAEAIATHPAIAPEEIERIHGALGAEMVTFEEIDEAVHQASATLRDVARTGDLQDVVRQLGEVQSGCVACHAQFRERLRTTP